MSIPFQSKKEIIERCELGDSLASIGLDYNASDAEILAVCLEPIHIRSVGSIEFDQWPEGIVVTFNGVSPASKCKATVYADAGTARIKARAFAVKLIAEGLQELLDTDKQLKKAAKLRRDAARPVCPNCRKRGGAGGCSVTIQDCANCNTQLIAAQGSPPIFCEPCGIELQECVWCRTPIVVTKK